MSTENQNTTPILVTDIGGTNCRLKILEIYPDENKDPREIASDVLRPWDYDGIDSLLKHYLKQFENTSIYPKYAVLGIPGAVINNTMMELCNIPQWKRIKGDDLAKEIKVKKAIFVNDFVCVGYAVQTKLKEGKDYIRLNDKKLNNVDRRFAIGPGTGLGLCTLIKSPKDKYYTIIGSEGSHQDFAPKNREQFAYMEFLQKYYNIEYISCEKACSGGSIIPIYKFLDEYHKNKIEPEKELNDKIKKIFADSPNSEVDKINVSIVSKGLNEECPLCKLVVEFFVELLGNITGNMSVFSLPFGGVFIVGGLSAALRKVFESGLFQKNFMKRGEQTHLLATIPIVLVLESNLGMVGAIECGKRMVLEEIN